MELWVCGYTYIFVGRNCSVIVTNVWPLQKVGFLHGLQVPAAVAFNSRFRLFVLHVLCLSKVYSEDLQQRNGDMVDDGKAESRV